MNKEQQAQQVKYIKSLEERVIAAESVIGAMTVAKHQDATRIASQNAQVEQYIHQIKDDKQKLIKRIHELEIELKAEGALDETEPEEL